LCERQVKDVDASSAVRPARRDCSYRRPLVLPQWRAERRLSVRGRPPVYNIAIIAAIISLWRSYRYHTTAAMMLILLSYYYTHSCRLRQQSTWLVPTYPTLRSACALTWYCVRGLMKSDLCHPSPPPVIPLTTPPNLAAVRPDAVPVLLFLGLARVDDGNGMPISSRAVYATLRNRSARPVVAEKGRSWVGGG